MYNLWGVVVNGPYVLAKELTMGLLLKNLRTNGTNRHEVILH